MHSPTFVFFASTSYPKDLKDWKGVFIRQLLKELAGHSQVKIKYWGPPGEFPACIEYACSADESAWLNWLMEQGGIAHLLRQSGFQLFFVIAKLVYYLYFACKRQSNVEIFHINWLQNAILLWRTRTPAVIAVLGSDFNLLRLPGMTALLRFVLKRRRCVIAPNAEWMKNELEQRFGDIAQIIPISLGINDEWFAIKKARPSADKSKWIVVSRLTSRKIGLLFDWGEDIFLDNSKHELHLFGPMQEQMLIPDWVHYHGATHPQDLCENWFPQATGLITLSQHDEGRPQVMLEAMASGLPVVASNLPAHNDFIVHKKTGLLVASQKEFTESIEWLTHYENNQQISVEARHWVRREVGTWADCAERYISIYTMLLNGAE